MSNPIGPHCPIDLPERGDWSDPYVVRLSRSFDAEGCERGERINGFDQCPNCGIWYPCIEEPDCWTESDVVSGQWTVEGWWGSSYCNDCELLLVTQPYGTPEAYHLRS